MSSELSQLLVGLEPRLLSMALISSRLVPVAFLCPLFGGPAAPTHVKLGVAGCLALSLHLAGGIGLELTELTALEVAAMALKEVAFGTTIGLLAGLPFDAARMGGRFIDLFRGSSAEAALPLAGSKEAATGEGLYHLLLGALCVTGGGSLLLMGIGRSFKLVPLGLSAHSEALTMEVVGWVSSAFATALALGAPVAAASLAVDFAFNVAGRAASGLSLGDLGGPVRLALGGVVSWLSIGLLTERLLAFAADAQMGLLELLRHST